MTKKDPDSMDEIRRRDRQWSGMCGANANRAAEDRRLLLRELDIIRGVIRCARGLKR